MMPLLIIAWGGLKKIEQCYGTGEKLGEDFLFEWAKGGMPV